MTNPSKKVSELSTWGQVKALIPMIPELKMDHLPFFTNYFKKGSSSEESSILENEEDTLNLFNAFELLAISHTFLPQKLS
jgi:hypothetical protein